MIELVVGFAIAAVLLIAEYLERLIALHTLMISKAKDFDLS